MATARLVGNEQRASISYVITGRFLRRLLVVFGNRLTLLGEDGGVSGSSDCVHPSNSCWATAGSISRRDSAFSRKVEEVKTSGMEFSGLGV